MVILEASRVESLLSRHVAVTPTGIITEGREGSSCLWMTCKPWRIG